MGTPVGMSAVPEFMRLGGSAHLRGGGNQRRTILLPLGQR